MPVKRVKNLSLSFSAETADAICAYAETAGLETMQDAIRQLVAMALSSTPQEGILVAQQLRVYNELKKYGLTTMSIALKQMLTDMEHAIRDPDGLGSYLGDLAPVPGGPPHAT